MGKDTSRRKKTKRAGRRSKRVKRETPRFPLYRQVGGATALELLTNLPGGNGSTNLAAWYDASDPNGNGTQPSNGASITTWADKSGKARHLQKGLGTINYRASLTDSNPSFNKPAIDLRTSGGGSLVSTATFNLSQNFSIYLVGVVKADTFNGVNMHWSTIWGHHPVTDTGARVSDYNDRNGFLSITKSSNTSVYLRLDSRDRQSSTSETVAGSTTEFDKPFILSYRVIAKGSASDDRTMMRRYVMGTNANSPVQYTSVSPFTGNARITSTPANIIMGFCPEQQYTGNYLSEAIYFQETHTDYQANLIEAYLAWKWGFQTAAGGVLPVGGYYISADPTPSFSPSSGLTQYSSAYNMLTNLPGTTGGATRLAAWYDASDPNGTGIKPTDGAEITKWVDKSGNGQDLTPEPAGGPATAKVFYRNSLTNSTPQLNKPAFDFITNYGARLVSPNSKSFYLRKTFSVYLVAVAKNVSSSDGTKLWVGSFFSHMRTYERTYFGQATLWLSIKQYPENSPLLEMNQAHAVYAGSTSNIVTSLGDAPFIVSFRVDCLDETKTITMVRAYKLGENNSLKAFTDTTPFRFNTQQTSSFTTTLANIMMGKTEGGNLGAYISEAIYFQETHTDQQADVIEAYLAWKWGFQTAAGGVLPSSNPYVTQNSVVAVTPQESAARASAATASAATASGQIASGQIASGQQASGQIASGQRASAAIASGQIASGQRASGQIASGQIASAAFASGQQYSGAFASGQQASGQQYSGAFASGQIASAAYAIGQKESAAFASGQIASAAYASGQQYSGAFASGQQASGQQYSGAFASGQQYSGAFASGQQASGQQASSALGVKSLGQDPGSGKFLLRLQPL